ncbi:S1 family peptidase [Arthrobacter sp. UYEF21]|uniref:S1 family peptidase n=1 Tax=Arthrobacter sp. UYEF21 TaxID=1756364 RepID=UPI00339314B9
MKRIFAAGTLAGMALALALGFGAVPAGAFPGVVTTESSTPGSSGTNDPSAGGATSLAGNVPTAGLPSAGPSEAGLSEAVLRDLGMNLPEFNAAGELGRRAAGAMKSLQVVQGFVGVSLKNSKILVQGAGPALQSKVDELNHPGPASFVLVAPSTPEPPAQPPTPASKAASPTPSSSEPEVLAQNIDQLFQAYVRDVGTRGLQAVAYTDGHFVIRTGSANTSESDIPGNLTGVGPPQASANGSATGQKLTPAQFVSRYTNVQLEKGAAVKTEDDIFGGQGYFVDNLATCSTGFSAFGPTGLPLVLTAGHCTKDGLAKAASLEPLSWAPAARTTAPAPSTLPSLAPLGSFGFSQFGGPNNAAATVDGAVVGTDIAVLRDITRDLNLQPAATTWGTVKTPDPVKIVGTTAPLQGEPVCRSGRTTGWKCGAIDSIAIVMMRGSKSVPPDYDNDLRPVRAFDSASVKSAGGDSGGPWISGNYAVGTHTGAESLEGVQTRAIAATLEDSVTSIPGGVQLQLFLNKPTVTSHAPGAAFDAGQTVTGRVPAAPASAVAAGSKVRITVAGETPIEVPADLAGAWSFTAPAVSGPLRFTAETVNGFSTSGPTAFEFAAAAPTPEAVQPAPPAPPAPSAQPAPPAQLAVTPAPVETPAAVPAANGASAPLGNSAAVVLPLGDDRSVNLANTGVSGLLLAAGIAAGALAVGGVFLALVRRRKRQLR